MDQPRPLRATEQLILQGESEEALTLPMNVRVAKETLHDMNRIEAYFRGRGYRHVNRSHIMRVAFERLIQETLQEHPEIKEIPTFQ